MGTPLAFFKRTRLITPLSSFAAKGTPSCTRTLRPAHRGVLACRSSVLLVLSGGRLPEWTSRSPKVRKPKKQSKLKLEKLLPKTAVQDEIHSELLLIESLQKFKFGPFQNSTISALFSALMLPL